MVFFGISFVLSKLSKCSVGLSVCSCFFGLSVIFLTTWFTFVLYPKFMSFCRDGERVVETFYRIFQNDHSTWR